MLLVATILKCILSTFNLHHSTNLYVLLALFFWAPIFHLAQNKATSCIFAVFIQSLHLETFHSSSWGVVCGVALSPRWFPVPVAIFQVATIFVVIFATNYFFSFHQFPVRFLFLLCARNIAHIKRERERHGMKEREKTVAITWTILYNALCLYYTSNMQIKCLV